MVTVATGMPGWTPEGSQSALRSDSAPGAASSRQIQQPDAAVPAETLKARIVAGVKKRAFLDLSRSEFVDGIANSLVQLVRGGLVDCNRFNCLLLGRKAVGKTFLLKALTDAASEHLSTRRLRCVTLTYATHLARARSFVDILAPAVGYKPPHAGEPLASSGPSTTMSGVPAFIKWLVDQDLYLFCTADELQFVYTADCEFGGDLIRELLTFGDSSFGRILWVLSGSSSDLRRLATGKWAGDARTYPHYRGLDLNGTKFVPASIYPFLSADDFSGLVDFLLEHPGGAAHPLTLALWQLYLYTGGVPGATRAALGGGSASQYSTSSKGLGGITSGDRYSLILKAVLDVIDAQVGIKPQPQGASGAAGEGGITARPVGITARPVGGGDCSGPDESDTDDGVLELTVCARWTHWVPLASVKEVNNLRPEPSQRVDPSLFEAACYDLADRGLLRYDDTKQEVSLGSPRILLDILDDRTHVTVEEAIALRTRNQGIKAGTDVAGDVTLRLIATRTARQPRPGGAAPGTLSPFGFHIIALPPTAAAGRLESLVLGGRIKHTAAQVVHRMWREGASDELGADGTVLEPALSDTEKFDASRIQVKVRTGRLVASSDKVKGDSVDDIIQRFSRHRETTNQQYAAAGLPLASQRWILATTQNVLPGAMEALTAAGITLWDRPWLATHAVWPLSVRRLDPKMFDM